MRLPLLFVSVYFALIVSRAVMAHELWLEPKRYQIAPGSAIIADIRIGDKFSGATNTYIPDDIARFEIVQNGKVHPVKGRLGDIPPLDMVVAEPGLAIVVYQTTPLSLRYYKQEKFEKFVRHKDFPETLAQHKARVGCGEAVNVKSAIWLKLPCVAVKPSASVERPSTGSMSGVPSACETAWNALIKPCPKKISGPGSPRSVAVPSRIDAI